MGDRAALVRAHQSGHLLEAISAAISPDRSERSELVSDLVELQNEGLIDLIDAFSGLKGRSVPGYSYFRLRHILEEALPELEASVPDAARCVQNLYREAGPDLAAGTILDAFQEFCAKRADRVEGALAEIEAAPEDLADLLVSVLVAGSKIDPSTYVIETIRLARHPSLELRRGAIFAFGRLHGEKELCASEDVAAAIERVVDTESDDQALACVIKSSFALSQLAEDEARWISVIACALSKGGEIALHAASEIFGLKTKNLPKKLLDLLLEHLARVKPSNKNTLNNIDWGIARLFRGGKVDAGLAFLESVLRAHPEELDLSTFEDSAEAIRDIPGLRSRVATRWLLTGEPSLCQGVNTIAGSAGDGSPDIEADAGELSDVEPISYVFVARKAIGYLFLKPVAAASFLQSLLRQAPSDTKLRSDLEALFLNPLLLNFGGQVAEYLTGCVESDEEPVQSAIQRALDAFKTYVDDLASIGEIPALYPSLEHRDAYRRHRAEMVARSFKKAQEEPGLMSDLMQIAHRSTLLYGRKAIHHVFGPEGDIRRMETLLGEYGTRIEIPRMTILDPEGLDLMLDVFRHERMSA